MRFHYKFEKILDLREKEKDAQAFVYEKAVQKFKEAAEILYKLLKKKEDVEEYYYKKIQEGICVSEIQLEQQYMTKLQNEIDHYQRKVIRSRAEMQMEEQKLIEKNIEVKKLEKIKDKEYTAFLNLLKSEENKVMDEISMQIVAREK